MKKIFYLITIGILSILYACTDDPLPDNANTSGDQTSYLTTTEAREYFETNLPHLVTRSQYEGKRGIFDPGNLVPYWNKAIESSDQFLGSVDVEAGSSYRYQVGRIEFKKGEYRTYWVTVIQRLVVIKNRETQQKDIYLLNIIPEKGYEQKHKGKIAQQIINSKTRGNFSGLLIYTTLDGKLPVRLSRYKDGKYINGAFLYDPQHDRATNLTAIMREMKSLLFRYKKPLTRSMTEDDWSGTDKDDELDNYFPYSDANGNVYLPYDSDGDGINDSYMIGTTDVWGNTSDGGNGNNESGDSGFSEDPTGNNNENANSNSFAGNTVTPGNPDPSTATGGGNNNSSTHTYRPEDFKKLTSNISIQNALCAIVNQLQAPITTYFLNLVNNSNINFVPSQGSGGRIMETAIYPYPNQTYKYKITYLENLINQQGNMSLIVILLHEMFHMHNAAINGVIHDPSNPNATNDRDHEDMAGDAEYENHLRNLFPGFEEEEYIYMTYAGTMDSPVFRRLSWSMKQQIIRFFERNHIY